MRRASRASPNSVSSAAACSPAARSSGHATTTVEMLSSLSAERATSAVRSGTAPSRMCMERSCRTRALRVRPVTAWTRIGAGAPAAHWAAGPWSQQIITAGAVTSSQTAAVCSTSGGRISTTFRPRCSAALACPASHDPRLSKGGGTRSMVASGTQTGNGAGQVRNAECGMRNVKAGSSREAWLRARTPVDQFRTPRSAFRIVLLLSFACALAAGQTPRPRARELGIVVGVLPPGPLDAITDVDGVRVGHATVIRGDSINTGVTAILPHAGNVFREKVAAAIVVGNGFGKLAGSTQVNELGELESPIVLTCTLCVPRAADAVLTWLLGLPGNNDVRSANAVVAETNDGLLNDIRVRAITPEDVLAAIRTASPGAVGEGAVGAGRGTVAFGWKGGIGTASRRLPLELGGWTVGALVQSNFGGVLTIAGAPVGRELGQYYLKDVGARHAAPLHLPGDGSIIIVVATDAPSDHR